MSNGEIKNVGKVFGEILRRQRTDLKISQEELAHRAGVDRTFISRMERGIRQPTLTTLISVAQALGVPSTKLLNETESRLVNKE